MLFYFFLTQSSHTFHFFDGRNKAHQVTVIINYIGIPTSSLEKNFNFIFTNCKAPDLKQFFFMPVYLLNTT